MKAAVRLRLGPKVSVSKRLAVKMGPRLLAGDQAVMAGSSRA